MLIQLIVPVFLDPLAHPGDGVDAEIEVRVAADVGRAGEYPETIAHGARRGLLRVRDQGIEEDGDKGEKPEIHHLAAFPTISIAPLTTETC